MGNRRPASRTAKALWLAAATAIGAIVIGACSHDGAAPPEDVGEAKSAAFTNGGFETGTPNQVPPAPWVLTTFLGQNNIGYTQQTPQTLAGLNLVAGGNALTTTLNGANQPDPDLGAGATLRWPRYGSQCARINFHSSNNFNNGRNVNQLTQTMTVGAGDVDPTDNKVHVRFVVAPVLEDPNHPVNQQPYFFVQVTNVTQANAVLYTNFNFSNQPGVPWQTVTTTGANATTYRYTNWQLVDVAPGSPAINMGDQIQLVLIAAGCSQGAHEGMLYVDGVGSSIPGLFVSGTGPAQANAGTNITYTINYKNGSASTACTTSANCTPTTEACVGGVCAETGVVMHFTTPPGTTYQSSTTPAGTTCVTPAVGATGTIVCTFTNPVPPAAAGSFTVTVNIDSATTGDLVCGTYDIGSTQETPLLGNKVDTYVGCLNDAQCPTGTWCQEAAPSACLPKLPNGTAIPTDAPHTGPTLNGTCTTAAAMLVCQSGVCDTNDNKCGYANGDGTCDASSAATVCRSGICDTADGKCGCAVGDGPCNAGNAGTVCRSGACSTNGNCMPVGGCNVDLDCTGGKWCSESTHTCTAKIANGVAMPKDAPHTSPTLDGTCSTAAATLVCASGVCDTADNKCGYANGDGTCDSGNQDIVCRSGVCDGNDKKCGFADGDGSCTQGNASTVCRSATCSTNGVCEPVGGCNVDADCTGGAWCNETTHACSPKIANGVALPKDAPHTSPTLDGTCTTAAATLVCASSVCDTADNKCGYADGDGTCTQNNAAVVCRSGACSTTGVCEPTGGCIVDADCPTGNWCNETTRACSLPLTNGTALPTDAPHKTPTLDGTCTKEAATLVCKSGVCDTKDNKCGLADGDGPCDSTNGATICRSGVCASDGTCEPPGGCNADADCTSGNWCNETTHMCSPKLTNGTAIPTDTPHKSPTLDGTCTTDASALVCKSAVCDTKDDKCGYANGDGSCTDANGATVCRSTICATSGANQGKCVECVMDAQCKGSNPKCETTTNTCSTGCDKDSDCPTANWCNESAHMCTPKLPNGSSVATDGAHTMPTLDGTCTQEVGTLVCASGACDTKDNKCGLVDGDGPCTEDGQCRTSTSTCDMASKTCVPKGSGIVASGAGLICAARGVKGEGEEGGAGAAGWLAGLVVAAAAMRRRGMRVRREE